MSKKTHTKETITKEIKERGIYNFLISLKEIKEYIKKQNYKLDPYKFYSHFRSTGGLDGSGNSINDNWQKVIDEYEKDSNK